MTEGHHYDGDFFSYIEEGSLSSARRIVPFVLSLLSVSSVLDVGCGRGAWLRVWGEEGVTERTGVDGDYVERSALMMPVTDFEPRNIARPFDLKRRYDLVSCLEVAEHLDDAAAEPLIDSLTRHGDLILFSAAPPGQGGEHHVNEQPYEYWRDKFAARGYRLFDCLRPVLAGDAAVEPWYRYNMFLFVSDGSSTPLPQSIRAGEMIGDAAIPDVAPLLFRLRKLILRQLSVAAVTRLALWHHQRQLKRQAQAGT